VLKILGTANLKDPEGQPGSAARPEPDTALALGRLGGDSGCTSLTRVIALNRP